MSEFLAMGGYAVFVWPAYVVSLGGLALMAWTTLQSHRAWKKRIETLEADDHGGDA